MTQEQLRMQMLAGIITEGQYNNSDNILRAYEIAEEMVKKQLEFPDDAMEDKDLFLAIIKALNDILYEKSSDLFAKREGAAPDEY
jgi:hypothetical protein